MKNRLQTIALGTEAALCALFCALGGAADMASVGNAADADTGDAAGAAAAEAEAGVASAMENE